MDNSETTTTTITLNKEAVEQIIRTTMELRGFEVVSVTSNATIEDWGVNNIENKIAVNKGSTVTVKLDSLINYDAM